MITGQVKQGGVSSHKNDSSRILKATSAGRGQAIALPGTDTASPAISKFGMNHFCGDERSFSTDVCIQRQQIAFDAYRRQELRLGLCAQGQTP